MRTELTHCNSSAARLNCSAATEAECSRDYRIGHSHVSFLFVGTLRRCWQRVCDRATSAPAQGVPPATTIVLSYSLWPFIFGEGFGPGNAQHYAEDMRLLLETALLGASRVIWLGPTRIGNRLGQVRERFDIDGVRWRAVQYDVLRAFEAQRRVKVLRLDAWNLVSPVIGVWQGVLSTVETRTRA